MLTYQSNTPLPGGSIIVVLGASGDLAKKKTVSWLQYFFFENLKLTNTVSCLVRTSKIYSTDKLLQFF